MHKAQHSTGIVALRNWEAHPLIIGDASQRLMPWGWSRVHRRRHPSKSRLFVSPAIALAGSTGTTRHNRCKPPPGPMDTELVRFRIDPTLRDKAASICAEHGMELHDVLRLVVTQIAREGALPSAIGPSAQIAIQPLQGASPYDNRVWSILRGQLDAELAVSLLARQIADRSARLDEASAGPEADPELVSKLNRERAALQRLRRTLDVTDAEAVRRVLKEYGPAHRPSEG